MKKTITLFISMMITLSLGAQNIEFTFDNAQTTNDGANDFYEVDVMIAAVGGQADFKLGKGQIYINYNTAAFGTFINGSGSIEITYPEVDGYILGLTSGFPYYSTTGTGIADNSESRISFAYQQGISSGSMPSNNVTSTPTKLFHIKMQFTDAGQLPMVAFEDDESPAPAGVPGCRDQFETACGPSTSGFPDCVGFPGTVFNDADFDSGGATLSTIENELLSVLSVYPNPVKQTLYVNINQESQFSLIDIFGKIVNTGQLEQGTNELDIKNYQAGIYFLNIKNESGSVIKKVLKE